MDRDVLRSIEMVCAYTHLSEATARSLPVWQFFEQLDEARRRYEKALPANK